jgi:hypothetical protein
MEGNMLACFIWLIVATVFVQVPNLLGIQGQHDDGVLSVFDAMKIAAMTIPVTFIATTGFAIYYGRGDQYFSYPAMVIYAHTGALIVGFLIQVFLLKAREVNFLEIIGLLIGVFGLAISIYSKELLAFIRS